MSPRTPSNAPSHSFPPFLRKYSKFWLIVHNFSHITCEGSIQDRGSRIRMLYHQATSSVERGAKLWVVNLHKDHHIYATLRSTQVPVPPGARNFCRPKFISFFYLYFFQEGRFQSHLGLGTFGQRNLYLFYPFFFHSLFLLKPQPYPHPHWTYLAAKKNSSLFLEYQWRTYHCPLIFIVCSKFIFVYYCWCPPMRVEPRNRGS